MNLPLIGLTPRLDRSNNGEKIYLNKKYIDVFNSRKALAIILPVGSPNLEAILKMCDGLVITGGGDINPEYYHETNAEGLSKDIEPLLDELDRQVVEHALKYQKPLLGICRGVQAINAFAGGSLYQDIPGHGGKTHEVRMTESRLFRHILPDTFTVNSFHHQALKVVAPGFRVNFMADGLIEGIEHETYPIFGVQWHPERFDSVESTLIFDKFMDLVNIYRKKEPHECK
jgi:putative glutamine amidotransferase